MTPAQKTVLLIDDEPDIRECVQMILEAEGYQVLTAEDGQEVQRLVTVAPLDLIILDMFLPGTHGRKLMQLVRDQDQTRSTPILVLSALPGVEAEVRAIGANAFLAKPFDIDDLITTVASSLTVKNSSC